MKIDFNRTLFALSYALDCVEHDVIGVTTNHGKRVAAVAMHLSDKLSVMGTLEEKQVLSACSIMHDCALSEYIQDEFEGSYEAASKVIRTNLGTHCILGEESMKLMPFNQKLAKNAVLYHHENADGSGPFGMKSEDTPWSARLIAVADTIDASFDLSWLDDGKKERIIDYIKNNTGKKFTKDEAQAMTEILNENMSYLKNEKIDLHLQELLPGGDMECTSSQLMNFASVFAKVVDYKSHFTKTHSIGIAKKAYEIGKYYGVDEQMAEKLYFAGAMHDIGKLVVDRDVLEKPDKLSDSEYRHIQSHAYYTYKILSDIPGIEDITKWASYHHEKLDGTGYPFGLKANELGKWDRLMACLDIYQALTEERPYKKGMEHEKAISILKKMSSEGKLDDSIVNDIDEYYKVK